MTVSETDREIMGTPAAAKADLIAKAKVWRATRQPLITSRAEHRKVEASEHEARFQLANAALHWLWHEENPALTAALSDQGGVEQFISDMADSVNEVVGTARQKEMFKASLRLAISHARRKAAHRVAAPPPSSTAGEG